MEGKFTLKMGVVVKTGDTIEGLKCTTTSWLMSFKDLLICCCCCCLERSGGGGEGGYGKCNGIAADTSSGHLL